MNAIRNNPPTFAREISVKLLNSAAADLFYLYARTRQTRWKVRGPFSFSLHKLLDAFAARFQEYIDAATEHITALGGYVEGTLGETVRQSCLEQTEDFVLQRGERDWLAELANAHAACRERMRAALKRVTAEKDFGTAELLTGLLRDLDRQQWILEAQMGWRNSGDWHQQPALTH